MLTNRKATTMSIPPDPRKLKPKTARETILEWPNAQACAHVALISLTLSTIITLFAGLY
jgi:hypothetical protein